MSRRLFPNAPAFVLGAGVLLTVFGTACWSPAETAGPSRQASNPQDKESTKMNEQELRQKLTEEQFYVTQQCGTEPPFRNAYWNNKKPGIYVSIVSGEPLFSSKAKFDSGTGWPSFFEPIDKAAVEEKADTSHGMTRVEVRSKKDDSHLGHVFEDGPQPTGMRYCINSAALRFIPVEDLEKEGYGKYKKLFEEDAAKKP